MNKLNVESDVGLAKPVTRNKNLHKAKKAKNDEFYTQIGSIERELRHYKDQFKGKKVFCNCDDPAESNFWKYFSLNFEFLGLERLVTTHYKEDSPTYALEINSVDGKPVESKTNLKQNGDFRSDESLAILAECDIVVTNPPFSLFREYMEVLMESGKKFLVIGNNNAITYKDIFKHIYEGNLWLGLHSNKTMEFKIPDYYTKWNREDDQGNRFGKVPACSWFTNMEHKKRQEEIILFRTYKGNETDYPKYDNYDAIEVSKVKNIPKDYYGVMGVPITYLTKHNPDQFEIIGITAGRDEHESKPSKRYVNAKQHSTEGRITNGSKANTRSTIKHENKPNTTYYTADNCDGFLTINYARILIKRKLNQQGE